MHKLRKFLSLILLVTLLTGHSPAMAQEETGSGIDSFDARNAFGAILVAGLVGGVLGLSTLSFYEKPNEHLRNITLGAGAGMIGAALYLTFKLASDPKLAKPNATADVNSSSSYNLAVVPLLDTKFQGLNLSASF